MRRKNGEKNEMSNELNKLEIKPYYGKYRIYRNDLMIAECSGYSNARLIIKGLELYLNS